MTRNPPVPVALLLALCFTLCTATSTQATRRGRAAAPAKPTKSAKQTRGREPRAERGRDRAAKQTNRRETRAERRARERAERTDARSGRGGRALSKRERLVQARREAEERRRREEAARRAELARQAAIARARAIEQAMRDEVAANIAKDDPTGEDPEVRRAALNALGNHLATVVVMDPRTGRIYSIVNQEWAVRRGYKPCSTIKLVTGLAGLSEHVIDPTQEAALVSLNSNRLDLTDALAFSNNGYFQNVGGRVGFDRMVSYARQLGLGDRTGINHANEYAGRVPLFKQGNAVNHMSSHGDDFEVTPVQLAALASVFANGGTLLTPHLPRTPQENLNFRPEVRRQLSVPQDVLRRMLPGMIGSVSYGSGRRAQDPAQTIAGKTGTCIGQSGWVGLFTSYAPVEDPQLAIAVIGLGPDARNHVPAWIAGQIYRQLNNRFGRRGNRPPYTLTPDILAPRPRVDAVAASEEDAEENATAGDEAVGAAAPPRPAPGSTAPASNVRRVLQPAASPTPAQTGPGARPTLKPAAPANRPQAQPLVVPGGDSRPRRVHPTELQ